MKRLLIFLVLVTSAAQAEIYKSQNEQGEWVYSDTPSPNARRLKLPPLSTYTAPPLPSPGSAPAPSGKPAAAYTSMVFIAPENDGTVRDNNGVVKVTVGLEPPLKQGHKIQYYLDGSPYGDALGSAQVTLKQIDRGTHVIGARVLSDGGDLLMKADPVTIHLHRQSISQTNLVKPPPALAPGPAPAPAPLPVPAPRSKPVF